VEFVLVSVLLAVLFLGILQVGLALHVRNTLVACAAEGARYGANADRAPEEGAELTRVLVRRAISDRFAQHVRADVVDLDGAAAVEVTVEAAVPVIGLLGPPRSLRVAGHALEEQR
jgi:Flp pilus assembly protein TadG